MRIQFKADSSILQCHACAYEHEGPKRPRKCPRCGGFSFERIELFAEDRAAEELEKRVKAHHRAVPA